MALPMTFRRRKMLRNKGENPDIYQYENMSDRLRVQLVTKLHDLADLGYQGLYSDDIYQRVIKEIRIEKGVFALNDRDRYMSDEDMLEFQNWLLAERDIDMLMTGLEIIMGGCSRLNTARWDGDDKRSELISQINALMLEDCFGFQFENGIIIEIGSEFIHRQVVVPVLGLLSDSKYATVNEEFRKAHDEFRNRDYEDSIHDCCNAFESMGKIIAHEKGWTEITDKSAAKDIVKAIFSHHFIPAYMEQEFTGLRTILESGINTVRNKAGGHGQGTTPRVIDKQVAEFQLNQTAAVLKLLAEYNK